MYSVSTSFLTALRQPSITSQVLITASDGTVLSAQSGAISMDCHRNITRTCDLELTATSTKSVTDVYNLVMTPNIEISVQRGIKLADGSFEYVPLGVFSTDTAELPKSVTGTVRWNGSDRSKKISRSKFTDPYQITSGTTLASAGGNLLSTRFADVTYNFANVTETINANVTFDAGDQTDPWECARNLFADYGYDLNFDGTGSARAVAVTDPTTSAAVFDFGAGSTNLVLDGTIYGSLEQTYNGVIATGEGTNVATPVRADLWDTDVTSPTYYLGGFGKVPLFYSSPLITTSDEANRAAAYLLAKLKGKSESFAWPAIVNPALEPLDVISMTIGGQIYQVIIDSLTIPLKVSEPMTASARLTAVSS